MGRRPLLWLFNIKRRLSHAKAFKRQLKERSIRFICPCGKRFTYELNYIAHIKNCYAYYEQEVFNAK